MSSFVEDMLDVYSSAPWAALCARGVKDWPSNGPAMAQTPGATSANGPDTRHDERNQMQPRAVAVGFSATPTWRHLLGSARIPFELFALPSAAYGRRHLQS